MTNWKPPTQDPDRKLTLPILQTVSPIQPGSIQTRPNAPSIQVDEKFIHYWQNGPTDTTPEALATAVEILGTSFGKLIKIGQGHVTTSHKENPKDLVTEMDTGIEMLIRIWLNTHMPTHKIIGEEGPKDTLHPDNIVWYVDPVDGTTNFVRGTDKVTLHWGCIKDSNPYVTFVGEPIRGTSLTRYFNQPASFSPEPPTAFTGLGTEFLDHRTSDAKVFDKLIAKFNTQPVRVKCIGLNLLEILRGHSIAFYKPRIKPWDIIAPLALIDLIQPNQWDILLHYTPNQDTLFKSNLKRTSPFDTSPAFLNHLNTRYQTNCRIGLATVTPKSRPDILESILDEFID